MDTGSLFLIVFGLIFLIWILPMILVWVSATKKELKGTIWPWMGVMFGWIGWLIYVISKPIPLFCPKCEKQIKEGFNSCPNCGYSLIKQKLQCVNCKKEIETTFIFCPYCNSKIK